VVGFIALLEEHVGGLFIAPAHHRRGIGTRLMRHVQAISRRLSVNVFSVNENARRFYEKCGFRPVLEQLCPRTGQMEWRMEWSAPSSVADSTT
jgi:ribosomal protein S18 acetylase RimI-like enzyme